eukprot:4024391-Lingulodinium_polyedra.AAC.1
MSEDMRMDGDEDASANVKLFTGVVREFLLWRKQVEALNKEEESVTQALVDEAVKAHNSMLTSISSGSELCENADPATSIAMQSILNTASSMVDSSKKRITEGADAVMQGLIIALNRSCAALKPRALGGTASNQSWTQGFEESGQSIADWFMATLDKVDAAKI